jgi:hypothetical protein
MCHPFLRRPYDVEHVCLLIRALYGDRLEFVEADREIAPGISVHHVGAARRAYRSFASAPRGIG